MGWKSRRDRDDCGDVRIEREIDDAIDQGKAARWKYFLCGRNLCIARTILDHEKEGYGIENALPSSVALPRKLDVRPSSSSKILEPRHASNPLTPRRLFRTFVVRSHQDHFEKRSLTPPFSLVISPITSYADQIFSIHRSKSCDGFSLDIPLIMLVASILKYEHCSDGTG